MRLIDADELINRRVTEVNNKIDNFINLGIKNPVVTFEPFTLEDINNAPTVEIIKCKDCKHFEYDHGHFVNGYYMILGHNYCNAWGRGCQTKEDGWCYLAEKR